MPAVRGEGDSLGAGCAVRELQSEFHGNSVVKAENLR